MRKILIVLAMALLSACASDTKYHFDLGARLDQHNERASSPLSQQLSASLGQTVAMTSGDDNKLLLGGYGLQVGLSEYHSKSDLVSRIGLYYEEFPIQNYAFRLNSGTTFSESLRPTLVGFEGMIGWELLSHLLQPHLTLKYEMLTTTASVSSIGFSPATQTTTTGNNFMLGGGVTVSIPLWNMGSLLVMGDYCLPVRVASSISSMESWTGQIAYQFGSRKKDSK